MEEEAGSKSRALNGVLLQPYLNGTGPSGVCSLFSAPCVTGSGWKIHSDLGIFKNKIKSQ